MSNKFYHVQENQQEIIMWWKKNTSEVEYSGIPHEVAEVGPYCNECIHDFQILSLQSDKIVIQC